MLGVALLGKDEMARPRRSTRPRVWALRVRDEAGLRDERTTETGVRARRDRAARQFPR